MAPRDREFKPGFGWRVLSRWPWAGHHAPPLARMWLPAKWRPAAGSLAAGYWLLAAGRYHGPVRLSAIHADSRRRCILPAYVILQFTIRDRERFFAEYVPPAVASLRSHGGRFLVSSEDVVGLEGPAPLQRMAIIEFPSMEAARAWYESPGYQAVIPFRTETTIGSVYLVDGAG